MELNSSPAISLPPCRPGTLALNGSLCQDDIFANDALISGKWPDKKTASTSRNIQRPKLISRKWPDKKTASTPRNIQRPNTVVFVSYKICFPISIGSCERLRAG